MTAINSVAILGAGALGAAYASQVYKANAAKVGFIAEGTRYERLKSDGVVVNGTNYMIPVVQPEEATPTDLILVALKHHHLEDGMELLPSTVDDHTVIISVMNGLDSEPMLGERFGMEKLLYCISVGIDGQRTGNEINFANIGRLIFGEADNNTISERVAAIHNLFDAAEIPYVTPPDMIRQMWWKFMVNVGVNQSSTLLDAPYGVMQTSKHAQFIMEAAMREVIELAQAEGVNLTLDEIPGWYKILNTLDPEGCTSMLQDRRAGRVSEVDIFAGKVIELGSKHNIPTPINDLLFHSIKSLEENS